VNRLKLTIAALAAVGSVALLAALGVGTALATNVPIQLHNNSAGVGGPGECPADTSVSYWHFVVVPNNNTSDFVTFSLNLGDASPYVTSVFVENGGQTDNVFVAVPAGHTLGDLVISGSTAVIDFHGSGDAPTTFNLSHVCPGGPPASISALVTHIHAGATDSGTPSPIANGSSIGLGSSVHDSARLTADPDVTTLPAGSTVTFYFYNDLTCDDSGEGFPGDPADGPDAHSVAGMSTVGGLVVDPALAETALAPGNYSYRAFFESGDTDLILDATADCEPFTVEKGTLTIATKVHNAAHADKTNGSVALGSVIHDTAKLSGAVAGFAPDTTQISFKFYSAAECGGYGANVTNTGADEGDATATRSAASAALGAGDYGYKAAFAGDANYKAIPLDACEPVHVNKGDLQIRTDIHNAAHQVVLGVPPNSVVHDTATLSGAVTGFNPDLGQVSFAFSTNGTCASGSPVGNGTPESTFVARSVDSAALASGLYSYSASFAGDANFNPAGPATCEPLGVAQLGKTMGFWGNNNGQARIIANGGYAANAVNIGRGANVDTQPESLKILPNQLNACGKGTTVIFTGQTSSTACSVRTGINVNSLNTLSAQTLALGYNLKLVTGYSGNTIGGLSCTPVGSLTVNSSVTDAFNAAVALINGSASGGTTTQSQIGAMNTLLGCLNREAF